jgi:hypothetical protein
MMFPVLLRPTRIESTDSQTRSRDRTGVHAPHTSYGFELIERCSESLAVALLYGYSNVRTPPCAPGDRRS